MKGIILSAEVEVEDVLDSVSSSLNLEEVLDFILRLDLRQADYDFTIGAICRLLDSLRHDVPQHIVDDFDAKVEGLVNLLEEGK